MSPYVRPPQARRALPDYAAEHCPTPPKGPRRTPVPHTPPDSVRECPLDAAAVRTWCALALDALGRAREEIDAINVYPVADGDTGTNLYLTVESAHRAVEAAFTGHATADARDEAAPDRLPGLPDAVRAMAHGALIGARGNSGTILAQLLRGMAEILAGAAPGDRADAAELLRRALRRAVESAYEGVARPVEGTVLTVAAAAADAAATATGDVAAVARAADEAARTALAMT
ncbi:DAK2 domain-containing protein, partial [Streptomyces sp. ISL-11]|uniref:DAK2 domain-containing protein n=1 Tax=Streptomyces sp. ISL-11 TaxID=2819174 RepID=UPI001BE82CA4|nr:DAK2 domain-containing protein [Streptomyces sp. ISL-11]